MSRAVLLGVPAGLAAAIALLDVGGFGGGGGALLVALALGTALAQGSVAVAAAAELTGARWTAALRPRLLSAARLLPLLALLFLLLARHAGLYPWMATPGAWLSRPFFFARNAALLLATAAAAFAFARLSLRRAPAARRAAVVYLLLFTASETLVAFDWIMSLAFPWVSSMLGLYFTVEAFYGALALAGLLVLAGRRAGGGAAPPGTPGGDVGLLLFGFSVLWGGLFFAQFLLLWYGNLPAEVGFIAERLAASPTRELGALFVAACFGVPFVSLLGERAKRSALVVGAASASILAGLVAERLYLVWPVLRVQPGALAVYVALLAAAWGAAGGAARGVTAPAARGEG